MAPSKKKNDNLQQQKILQAVVVADNFDDKFRPVSEDVPPCLFPLVNQPLLAYTLEFLELSGVQHIYVFCSQSVAQVKDFLANSKWSSKNSPCKVTPVVSGDFTSLGDVLRDIDHKALFETDFILVSGNVVSNMSLTQALSEHRGRREKDKNKPLMTVLLKKCPPVHTTRSADEDLVVALNSDTEQLLYYQSISTKESKINFPMKNLLQPDSPRFDLRYDLSDTRLSICSPQVPQLFTDNFDYQTLEDFIKGILINEEFLGNQIHAHIVQHKFVAGVASFHLYDAVSRAVIARWVYPHVPDNNSKVSISQASESVLIEPQRYCHLRHNVYLGSSTSLGKDSTVNNSCIIGHNTRIGNGCQIRNSIIGCDCTIGDNVKIEGSYLWHGVTVESNCDITSSVLCNNVTLHEDCMLKSGCILSCKVEVGPNVRLKSDTIIQQEQDEEIFTDADKDKKKNPTPIMLGEKARGFLWSERKDEEDSDEEVEKIIGGLWGMSVSERDRHLSASSESLSSKGETSDEEADVSSDDEKMNSIEVFYKEVKESLIRGIEEKINCNNLILEINSSKYAHNVTVTDCITCVTKACFEIATTKEETYFSSLKKILSYLFPVFLNYNKSSKVQLECMFEIEKYCLLHKQASDCLMKVMMLLYENDIVEEDTILRWHSNPRSFPGQDGMSPEKLRISVLKFINWLQEAEEESSEED